MSQDFRCFITSDAPISITRQCELLHIPRSSYYENPEGVVKSSELTEEEIRATELIDAIHQDMPYLGARRISVELSCRTSGEIVLSRKQVARLMALAHIHADYPKPDLSKPDPKEYKMPYLLKNKQVFLPNQVWSIDITYVKCKGQQMYVTAIIDWHSRNIISWRLSDNMRTEGIVRQVEDAFQMYGTPAILNSDQDSQFTSKLYCELLSRYNVVQSMDGRGRWRDNVVIERWFRSLKHEGLRSQEYTTPRELYRVIDDYVYHYNNLRPHKSLGYDCPAQWYYSGLMAA